MNDSLTLFDRLWNAHVILRKDGAALLWIDRHLLHEGVSPAFDHLARSRLKVRRPDLTFGMADRYVGGPDSGDMIARMRDNARGHAFDFMDATDPRRGIVHVAAPENGLIVPGISVACADSHAATLGAFGCLALSIDHAEAAHVLATQTLWRHRPSLMRITIRGTLGPSVTAKDLMLAVIARIGPAGAAGHAIEFTGDAITAMSMEARMTLCNMAVEAGAWTAMIAPDDTTFAYLRARPRVPKAGAWDHAVLDWRRLTISHNARFDIELTVDASVVEPSVTWGTNPGTALPVSGRVPDPAAAPDTTTADAIARQLAAMGLVPCQELAGLRIDRIFIGSCTNGRIEDLRAAAAILRGRTAVIPGLIVAGSVPVKRQAEREGLHHVFIGAGLTWGEPGCSACVGLNGEVVPPGQRCAATINRNAIGRQGPGSRTHLMSPAMAAAAAVTGMITDVRRIVS